MQADFNPYHVWFGIPPEDQPADHYRLLGVRRFESNADVIANGMEQRIQFLRSRQIGKHQALSQRLANEVSAAAGCLLDPQQKAAYDLQLRQQHAAAATGQPVIPIAPLTPIVVGPARESPLVEGPRPSAGLSSGTAATIVIAGLLLSMSILALGLWAAGVFDSPEPTAASPAAALPPAALPPATPVKLVPPPASTPPPPIPPQSATKITAPAPGTIDLLRRGAEQMVVKRGSVARRKGELCLDGAATALAIPATFPEQYAVEAEVTRESGNNSLCFGFPVHGRPLTAIVDGFHSTRSGLACIDGHELYSPACPFVREGAVLTNGQKATVRIEVWRKYVELAVNGRWIVRWEYDPRARVRSAQGMAAPQLDQLHLFAWDSSYRISRLELVPLSGP